MLVIRDMMGRISRIGMIWRRRIIGARRRKGTRRMRKRISLCLMFLPRVGLTHTQNPKKIGS
jgi:hypothetical protein